MQVLISLALPVEAHSVPLARHLVAVLLRDLGVTDDATHAIELALSEACTNVVRHAESENDYELRVKIGDTDCDIVVADRGKGFDADGEPVPVRETSSSGRGLELMRTLMDHASFESSRDLGTAVRLHKRLSYEGSPPASPSV